jgi:hypothetical protein
MSQCFWLQENKTAIFYSKFAGIFLHFGWKFAYFFPNREKIIVGVPQFDLLNYLR